jgi:hypothetical protein
MTTNNNNEVAKLRELLNRALECLKVYGGGLGVEAAKQISEQLATAPEEQCSDDTANPADMDCEDYKTSAHPNKCIGNVTETTIEGVTMDDWYGGFSKIESTDRLAHAPEEQVAVNSEPTNLFVDQKTQNVSDNEWRIKSPKEYIENGDEYERNYFWLPVPSRWVGQLVEVRKPKIRTRRPLPKPKLTRASYDEDWNLKLKQK